MTQLTKEHFDEQLGKLEEHFEQRLDKQTETLAKAVNAAFDHHRKEYLQEQFDRLTDTAELRNDLKSLTVTVEHLKQQFQEFTRH